MNVMLSLGFFLIKTDTKRVNPCKYKFSELRQKAESFLDFFQMYWQFPIMHLASFSIIVVLLIQII